MSPIDWCPVRLEYPSTPEVIKATIAASDGVAIVSGIPLDPWVLLEILRELGELRSKSGVNSRTDPFDYLNYVHCPTTSASDAGDLKVHSGRAYDFPRPRYQCLMMVDRGWVGAEPGRNGESTLSCWDDVAQLLASSKSTFDEQVIETLLRFPVAFRSGSESISPLLYPAPDFEPSGSDDVLRGLGARLPQSYSKADSTDAPEIWKRSFHRFVETANASNVLRVVQLNPGDLLLVDNNRYGHGRTQVQVNRVDPRGITEYNTRQLWSACI